MKDPNPSGQDRDLTPAEARELTEALQALPYERWGALPYERWGALRAILESLSEEEARELRADEGIDWAAIDAALNESPRGPKHKARSGRRDNVQPTSLWAMRRAAKNAKRQRDLLLELFTEAGAEGLTDQESFDRLGLLMQSITPLRGGLVKSGQVVRTLRKRKTRSGADAIVWVGREFATPEEIEAAQEWVPTGIARRVLDGLLSARGIGRTDQEGARNLRINRESYRQQRMNLERAGLVKFSGRYALSKYGRKRKVWVACELSEGGES